MTRSWPTWLSVACRAPRGGRRARRAGRSASWSWCLRSWLRRTRLLRGRSAGPVTIRVSDHPARSHLSRFLGRRAGRVRDVARRWRLIPLADWDEPVWVPGIASVTVGVRRTAGGTLDRLGGQLRPLLRIRWLRAGSEPRERDPAVRFRSSTILLGVRWALSHPPTSPGGFCAPALCTVTTAGGAEDLSSPADDPRPQHSVNGPEREVRRFDRASGNLATESPMRGIAVRRRLCVSRAIRVRRAPPSRVEPALDRPDVLSRALPAQSFESALTRLGTPLRGRVIFLATTDTARDQSRLLVGLARTSAIPILTLTPRRLSTGRPK